MVHYDNGGGGVATDPLIEPRSTDPRGTAPATGAQAALFGGLLYPVSGGVYVDPVVPDSHNTTGPFPLSGTAAAGQTTGTNPATGDEYFVDAGGQWQPVGDIDSTYVAIAGNAPATNVIPPAIAADTQRDTGDKTAAQFDDFVVRYEKTATVWVEVLRTPRTLGSTSDWEYFTTDPTGNAAAAGKYYARDTVTGLTYDVDPATGQYRPFAAVPTVNAVNNVGPWTGAADPGDRWGYDPATGFRYYVDNVGNWQQSADIDSTYVVIPGSAPAQDTIPPEIVADNDRDLGDKTAAQFDDYIVRYEREEVATVHVWVEKSRSEVVRIAEDTVIDLADTQTALEPGNEYRIDTTTTVGNDPDPAGDGTQDPITFVHHTLADGTVNGQKVVVYKIGPNAVLVDGTSVKGDPTGAYLNDADKFTLIWKAADNNWDVISPSGGGTSIDLHDARGPLAELGTRVGTATQYYAEDTGQHLHLRGVAPNQAWVVVEGGGSSTSTSAGGNAVYTDAALAAQMQKIEDQFNLVARATFGIADVEDMTL